MLEQKISAVQVVGGIGSQLGGYWFGKYLEQVKGHKVLFDTSEIDRGLTKHGSTVTSLDLEGDFVNLREKSHLQYLARRVSYAAKTRLPANFASFLPYPSYTAKEVGWAEDHELQPEGNVFRGEFFTTRYFESLYPEGRNFQLTLKKPSAFFFEMLERTAASRFLSVHLRRGDYRIMKDTFGLIGAGYYAEAIKALQIVGANWDKVVVFSDEMNVAKPLMGELFQGDDILYVEPPLGTDPAESLVLMTYASHHVICNSSFSMWGAIHSRNRGLVVAPSPWFRAKPEPRYLYPESFLKAPAHFE